MEDDSTAVPMGHSIAPQYESGRIEQVLAENVMQVPLLGPVVELRLVADLTEELLGEAEVLDTPQLVLAS